MKGIKRTLKEHIALLRLQAGDTEAFGFFYDQYAEKIYRFVYFKTSEKELAQDITHEVFLKAWEYIVDNKTIENLQAYLYKMARNKIADYYRSRDRQTTFLKDEVDTIGAPIEESETNADIYILEKHLKSLKDEDQEIIILRHIEGLNIEEMSNILGKDKNNVRVTLHRAIAKLKEAYYHKKSDDSAPQIKQN